MNKCRLRWESEQYRYGIASENIAKDELICGVPNSMWITLESICDDKESNPIVSELNKHSELIEQLSDPWRNAFYAVFLSEHQKLGAKSKHAAYLSSMQ